MMTKEQLRPLFDRAIAARHVGQLDQARDLFEGILPLLDETQRGLFAFAHCELGYINQYLGELKRSDCHFRLSTAAAPKSELASLGFFHTLAKQNRWQEAIEEMLRFVQLRDSEEYWELLSGDFCLGLPSEMLARALEARAILEKYRQLGES